MNTLVMGTAHRNCGDSGNDAYTCGHRGLAMRNALAADGIPGRHLWYGGAPHP